MASPRWLGWNGLRHPCPAMHRRDEQPPAGFARRVVSLVCPGRGGQMSLVEQVIRILEQARKEGAAQERRKVIGLMESVASFNPWQAAGIEPDPSVDTTRRAVWFEDVL